VNWYSLIKLSKNIELPQSIYKDIEDLANVIINDILVGKKQTYTIDYIDKYTNKNSIIYFKTKDNDNSKKNTIAIFLMVNKDPVICIFPGHMITNGLIKNFRDKNIKNILMSYLIHEVVHAVDIKSQMDSFREKREKLNKNFDKKKYYNFPPEFDAFSKQMSYDIVEYIKQKNNDSNVIKYIFDWLRSNAVILPSILKDKYSGFFSNIEKNNLKILKMRIYHDISQSLDKFKDNKNGTT
jgi:predicted metal-dependent hydrolase